MTSTISEAGVSTNRIDYVIKGPGGVMKHMSFSVSWQETTPGRRRVQMKTGQFLTTRSTVLFVPVTPKSAPALGSVAAVLRDDAKGAGSPMNGWRLAQFGGLALSLLMIALMMIGTYSQATFLVWAVLALAGVGIFAFCRKQDRDDPEAPARRGIQNAKLSVSLGRSIIGPRKTMRNFSSASSASSNCEEVEFVRYERLIASICAVAALTGLVACSSVGTKTCAQYGAMSAGDRLSVQRDLLREHDLDTSSIGT